MMTKILLMWEKLFTKWSAMYIAFVYKTSHVIKNGVYDDLKNGNNEKFVFVFWHGDSYSFFPVLKDSGIYIITTKNRRGDYIANLCHFFGYTPIRVPDESEGRHFIFKIRKVINSGGEGGHLALTLDGPLGPYHQPKDFPFMLSILSKRKMIPVSIRTKRKIHLNHRWDHYMIPLPFNHIEVTFHQPLNITKDNLENLKIDVKETIK